MLKSPKMKPVFFFFSNSTQGLFKLGYIVVVDNIIGFIN